MKLPWRRREDPQERIDALLAKHEDAGRAFFLMQYPADERPQWPPRRVRGSTISGWVEALRITHVNQRYLDTYAFPAGRSPIGWTLDQLTGSRAASMRLLVEFYSIGGFSQVELMRPRLDGHLMKLHGEYQVLHHQQRILGHYGLETDRTEQLVRSPSPALH